MSTNDQGTISFGKTAPFYFLSSDQNGPLPVRLSGELGYSAGSPLSASFPAEVLSFLPKAIEKALGQDNDFRRLPGQIMWLSKGLAAQLKARFGVTLTSFSISSLAPGPRDPELIRRLQQGG